MNAKKVIQSFRQNVTDKYTIYNSLFAALHFLGIANVEALLTIQQYSLHQLKKDSLTAEEKTNYEKLVIRSMFGIINAARNSAYSIVFPLPQMHTGIGLVGSPLLGNALHRAFHGFFIGRI